MPDIKVTTEGVQKLLEHLDPKKAIGPDMIPTVILKEFADIVAPILRAIFQQSLDSGKVPSDWKQANITAIYKKGNKQDPANYRPVSLTSVSCKVLEHIVYRQIMDHLDRHDILVDYQHGFRRQRSTETQLVLTIQDLAKSLDQQSQVDILILDFSKAFDTVAHRRLLRKLNHYGVRGNAYKWITQWLLERRQRVVVDGETSSNEEVISGVPQGTVLGPLMFLLYINDIGHNISSSIRLFADDCLLYREIRTAQDSINLQKDLDHLTTWAKDWQMSFNPTKCQTLRVTKKKNPTPAKYTMLGHTLEQIDHGKYLGVEIDKELNWSHHINQTTQKATRTINFLRRNIGKCGQTTKARAYTTMVRPHLEYASSAWDPHLQKQINQLERVQSKAARFVTGQYQRDASVTKMKSDLGWPSLQGRRFISRISLFYKCVHDQVAMPIPTGFHHQQQSRLHHQYHYSIPTIRTDVYKYSFFPRTIRCWNIIPVCILLLPTVAELKQGLYNQLTNGNLHLVPPRGDHRPRLGSSSRSELHFVVY